MGNPGMDWPAMKKLMALRLWQAKRVVFGDLHKGAEQFGWLCD